jgi:hypothetical protein
MEVLDHFSFESEGRYYRRGKTYVHFFENNIYVVEGRDSVSVNIGDVVGLETVIRSFLDNHI